MNKSKNNAFIFNHAALLDPVTLLPQTCNRKIVRSSPECAQSSFKDHSSGLTLCNAEHPSPKSNSHGSGSPIPTGLMHQCLDLYCLISFCVQVPNPARRVPHVLHISVVSPPPLALNIRPNNICRVEVCVKAGKTLQSAGHGFSWARVDSPCSSTAIS